MELEKFISKSSKVGQIYNLDHFRLGWKENVRRLMGNELVYPPSLKVIEAVKNIAGSLNYYPEDILTDVELRTKLAEYCNVPGRANCITCGNGSMEVIDMLYETFLDEGDEIIISNPDYSPYARRVALYGAKVIDVLPDDEDFNYSLKSYTEKITSRTKIVMLSRPNNPDGHYVSRELVRGLCEQNVIVVIDEAYVEFAPDTVEDMLDDYSNLIISHTFSKAMGLAGIRLGWIIASEEIIEAVNRIRTPLNVNLVAHVAAIAAIEDADYIRKNVENVKADRQLFFDEIKKIPGMHPVPSEANFVMVNCKETGVKASDIHKHLLSKGYLARCFVNARGLPGDQYFRVTIGTHEDVVNVLSEIKAFMSDR